jgi:hypothetical protein
MRIGQWERFIACADTHGDMVDAEASRAFLAHLAAWKPKHRLLLGDAFDFRPLRRKASAEEQREHLGPDIAAGKEFIRRMRPTHYLLGNHEGRLVRFAEEGAGAVGELARIGLADIVSVAKGVGATVYPYDKRAGVVKIGKLNFLHGFFVGVTAEQRHANIYGPCLFGHLHRIGEAPVPGLERRQARCIGAICQLDQEYNAHQPSSLAHEHGWAFGVIDKVTGEYHVWQARKVADQWLVPSDIQSL